MVTLRRRVQPVECLGGGGDCRIEADRLGRAADVVIDRLGDADDRDAELVEPMRDREATLSSDDDQCVEPETLERRDERCAVVAWFGIAEIGMLKPERIRAVGRTENGPAADEQTANVVQAEFPCPAENRAFVSVQETDNVPSVTENRCLDDGAERRIQAWCVATSGEYADSSLRHVWPPFRLRAGERQVYSASRANRCPPRQSPCAFYASAVMVSMDRSFPSRECER